MLVRRAWGMRRGDLVEQPACATAAAASIEVHGGDRAFNVDGEVCTLRPARFEAAERARSGGGR